MQQTIDRVVYDNKLSIDGIIVNIVINFKDVIGSFKKYEFKIKNDENDLWLLYKVIIVVKFKLLKIQKVNIIKKR